MTLIRSQDTPVWDHDGWRMTGLAAPSRGARELCTWHVRMEPGADGPPHRCDRELVVNVLEGIVRVSVDGVDTDIGAGEAFVIPANARRSISNPHKLPAVSLNAVAAGVKVERLDGIASNTPWLR
ncbi:MAG: cupin domain-containing protein [Parvibaculaceae bacterium]